jgi:DNA ligase-1
MQQFAKTCDAIAATTKKGLKTTLVADYFIANTADVAAVSAVFFSGRPFPLWKESTLQIGGRSLWKIIEELSGRKEKDLAEAYRRHGDLGAVAADVLPAPASSRLSVLDVERTFRQVAAANGAAARTSLVRSLLSQATPLEAMYIVKIMTGDLRIGLKESLVEQAIAKAFSSTLAAVQRANMLLGDIGQTLRLAAQGNLAQARMRLFHPLGFMLASPVESTEEALSYFAEAAVEDKYDGIRAQAHVSAGEVKIFSRTRDDITESFPELPPELAGLPQDAILDGEIVAWEYPSRPATVKAVVGEPVDQPSSDEPASEAGEEMADSLGRARPFSVLQQRLGRKQVSDTMLRETPVAYVVFDVLYANGELLIDRPFEERARVLDSLLALPRNRIHHGDTETRRNAKQSTFLFEEEVEDGPAAIIRAPVFHASSSPELEQLFVAARARGNEGLMIKDLQSPYTPGKRGKSWLKIKRELATLDVVVTAVEYGHGKRIGVLSDYTFAVWDRDADTNEARLVNIGKAYSGLTDAEIAEMTEWFLNHTLDDQGFRRVVEPKIVLEVAFNNMMQSDRHESGYALRFPRIVRLRPDKAAEDADTVQRAREIWESQG